MPGYLLRGKRGNITNGKAQQTEVNRLLKQSTHCMHNLKGWTTHIGSFIVPIQADIALSTIESAGSTLHIAHLVCQALWHSLGRQAHWV